MRIIAYYANMRLNTHFANYRFSKSTPSYLGQLKKITNKEIIIQPSGVNDIFFKKRERIFNRRPFKIIIASSLVKKKNLEIGRAHV